MTQLIPTWRFVFASIHSTWDSRIHKHRTFYFIFFYFGMLHGYTLIVAFMVSCDGSFRSTCVCLSIVAIVKWNWKIGRTVQTAYPNEWTRKSRFRQWVSPGIQATIVSTVHIFLCSLVLSSLLLQQDVIECFTTWKHTHTDTHTYAMCDKWH